MDPLYLTTAIPFVNGAPHLGHALEYVQADVLARHARARGRAVRFLTGTDEHAAKNAHAAERSGEAVEAFVARNAQRFRELAARLGVSHDDFIRTSADPRHGPAVDALWRRCEAHGDLYRRAYAGWYCSGCEEFVDGECTEHDAPLERVEEENWFFRLSRHESQLRELIGTGRLRIEPEARRNEVLGFIAAGLRDISVSRPHARVHGWGLPVPGDPEQIVYVWFDALANYVSALGFGGRDDGAYREWWCGDTTRVHVIGKGIVRFHAVIWPAILHAAGQPLPSTLLVHDYVTARGRKIGKSLGNTVDPGDLIERFGADALRWWLAREVPRIGETDFSEERLVAAANRDLARGVGNLVHRVVTLATRDPIGGAIPASDAWPLLAACSETARAVDRALDVFDLRGATGAILALVGEANRYIERTRPWELGAAPRAPVVAALVHAVRALAVELGPFVPDLASRVRERLGPDDGPVRPGPPVVPLLASCGRV